MDERDIQDAAQQPSNTVPDPERSGNNDAVFRDLAMKLIAARYVDLRSGEPPRLLVGQLPPNLSFEMPLPQQARLFGSLVQADAGTAIIVFETERSPDEVVAFYKERLTAAGWNEEEFMGQQRGFAQSGMVSPSIAHYFFGDSGPALIVTTFAELDGHTTAHLLLNPEGPRGRLARRRMGAARDMWSILPAIRAPMGGRQFAEGGSGGDDRVTSFARLETTRDLSSLAAHYGAQLEGAGWKRQDVGESGPIAWSVWAFTDTQGEPWRALFFILQQPDAAERYLLQVSAEWAGTGMHNNAGYGAVLGFQSHTVVGHSTAMYGPTGTTGQAAPQGGANTGDQQQEGKTKEP